MSKKYYYNYRGDDTLKNYPIYNYKVFNVDTADDISSDIMFWWCLSDYLKAKCLYSSTRPEDVNKPKELITDCIRQHKDCLIQDKNTLEYIMSLNDFKIDSFDTLDEINNLYFELGLGKIYDYNKFI